MQMPWRVDQDRPARIKMARLGLTASKVQGPGVQGDKHWRSCDTVCSFSQSWGCWLLLANPVTMAWGHDDLDGQGRNPQLDSLRSVQRVLWAVLPQTGRGVCTSTASFSSARNTAPLSIPRLTASSASAPLPCSPTPTHRPHLAYVSRVFPAPLELSPARTHIHLPLLYTLLPFRICLFLISSFLYLLSKLTGHLFHAESRWTAGMQRWIREPLSPGAHSPRETDR